MRAGIENSPGRFYTLFSSRAFKIVVGLVGIAGVPLTLIIYWASFKSRELVYSVHPAKTVVVKAGQSSRLGCTLDGLPVQTDVTAAQVAFWNEGKESIRHENVLSPFVIRTKPSAPILEARAQWVRRDVVGLTLDYARIGEGELGIGWKILERGDGAVIQVIYVGGPDTPISVGAVVEGQSHVPAVDYAVSPKPYGAGGKWRTSLERVTYIVLGLYIVLSLLVRIAKSMSRPDDLQLDDLVTLVVVVAFSLLSFLLMSRI